jgi:4-hydroxy-3-methylbut-2-enyl diphosphate reductase
MAPQVEVVIVVGSPNSSNSNRLREVAEKVGAKAYMVDHASQIQPVWLEGVSRRSDRWCIRTGSTGEGSD